MDSGGSRSEKSFLLGPIHRSKALDVEIILASNYLDVVSELIDTEANSSNRERSTLDRTERLIAGLFGLGMVGIGPILWLILPPGDGQVVASYAGAMFGLFGLLLLWYAYSA
ncbi:hypothetical protein [Halobellus sp. GM3]|uniref:hypothetical protein n=1 Tax=Halobellus sp. GM3 TaxID=3458410 RepID=UPI00403E2D85